MSTSFNAANVSATTVELRPGDSVACAFTVASEEEFTGNVRVMVGPSRETAKLYSNVTGATSFTITNAGYTDQKVFVWCTSYPEGSDALVGSFTVTRVTKIRSIEGSQILDQDGNLLIGFTASQTTLPAALSVGGVANVAGKLTIEDDFQVSGSSLFVSDIDVSGAAVFANEVTLESDATISGQLNVEGSAIMESDIICSQGLYVDGVCDFDSDVDVAKTIVAGDTDEYGFVHRTGLYDDIVVSLIGANPPGSEDDPAIDTTTGIPMFDKAATETLPFEAEIPHRWKAGGIVVPHIHCMADTATDPVTSPVVTVTDAVWTASTMVLATAEGNFSGIPEGAKFSVGYLSGTETVEIATLTCSETGTDTITVTAAFNSEDGSNYQVNYYLDNVVIRLQYAILGADSGSWDQSSYTTTYTTGRLNAHADTGVAVGTMIALDEINLSGYQDSCQIVGRISRMGGSALDNYDDDLHMKHMDLHYKVNTMGSLAAVGEDF